MADLQLGNPLGVTLKRPVDAKLAEITADGANTVTVSAADVRKFRLGQQITFRVKATGAGFGTTVRTITGLTSAGVITYDGADVATVAGTHAIYDTNTPYATSSVAAGDRALLNGSAGDVDFHNIDSMKARLQAADSSGYSNENLAKMSYNDLVYAMRVKFYSAGV